MKGKEVKGKEVRGMGGYRKEEKGRGRRVGVWEGGLGKEEGGRGMGMGRRGRRETTMRRTRWKTVYIVYCTLLTLLYGVEESKRLGKYRM